MDKEYDLIVIGAGPAGYVSAAAAAKRGMKTAIIESRQAGGTCLNRGCIPTKTIMHSSDLYRQMCECEGTGVSAGNASYSMEKIQAHKREVLAELRNGISAMLKKNKVEFFAGTARITAADEVEIRSEDEDGHECSLSLSAGKILVCTGASPAMPPIPGINLPNVLSSDELLDNETVYKRLVIIGGGVIGMEFASIYNALGTEVIVVEALDRILTNMDKELSQSLKMLLKKRGIEIHTASKVREIRKGENGGLICSFEEKEIIIEFEADAVLVATGRHANTEGLFDDSLDISLDRGMIRIDENYCTSVAGIYAAGDVIGGIQLAHAASAEGVNAVCHMKGVPFVKTMNVVPSCVYTDPEVASVGITADEAKRMDADIVTAKYPMSANGKSLLSKQERGFIKVTAAAKTGQILGAQMMCARATDMIGTFANAVVNGLTAEQMYSTIYPHPTFSEGIGEVLELLVEKL